MTTTPTTRLLPPALPARLVILLLSFSLLCMGFPKLVQAGPKRTQPGASVQSTIAHVDVTRLAADGKSETTRMSVRVTDNRDASELEMTIGSIRYQLKVSAREERGVRVVDVQLRSHGDREGSFEVSASSISQMNKQVLLAKNEHVKVSLTLE